MVLRASRPREGRLELSSAAWWCPTGLAFGLKMLQWDQRVRDAPPNSTMQLMGMGQHGVCLFTWCPPKSAIYSLF